MATSTEPAGNGRTEYRSVGRSDGLARRLVVVAVVVVCVAIAKPWTLGAPANARGPDTPSIVTAVPSPVAAAVVSASPVEPGLDAAHVACFASARWLLVTLERDGPDVTKSWYVVDPVPSVVGVPARVIRYQPERG